VNPLNGESMEYVINTGEIEFSMPHDETIVLRKIKLMKLQFPLRFLIFGLAALVVITSMTAVAATNTIPSTRIGAQSSRSISIT
jgi:hypothetical protein